MNELERLNARKLELESLVTGHLAGNPNFKEALNFYKETLITNDQKRINELNCYIDAHMGKDIHAYLAFGFYKELMIIEQTINTIESGNKKCIM